MKSFLLISLSFWGYLITLNILQQIADLLLFGQTNLTDYLEAVPQLTFSTLILSLSIALFMTPLIGIIRRALPKYRCVNQQNLVLWIFVLLPIIDFALSFRPRDPSFQFNYAHCAAIADGQITDCGKNLDLLNLALGLAASFVVVLGATITKFGVK